MPSSNSNPKTTCAAFGCTRWTRTLPHGWAYLCPTHWAMVPRRIRRLQRAIQKRSQATGTLKHRQQAARMVRRIIREADRNVGL